MAPEQFLAVVRQPKPNSRGFLLDRSEQTYDIALDKAPAETAEKPCVFWLGFPSGVGRCGIYSLRPYVCQTYPAFFQEQQVVRREDVLCPQGSWGDNTLQQPAWRERLHRMQVEFDIYALVVARWNYHVLHTPRPESVSVWAYYAFLLNVYTRLETMRKVLTVVEWQAMSEVWGSYYARGISPLRQETAEMTPWMDIIAGIRSLLQGFFPDDPVVIASPPVEESQQVVILNKS
jgi:hypothetical protein